MTLVIARQCMRAYGARMPVVLLRIVMLIALAFMPLGMASAPAVVANVPGTTAAHCNEHQKPADAPAKMAMHCAVCAALPASDTVDVEELTPQAPELFSALNALSDTKPEIATPPPRLA